MGDDTFFISHLLKENNKITIVDTDGQNTIQIPSNTYIDDILLPKDALHAALILSPYSCGKIKSIDV